MFPKLPRIIVWTDFVQTEEMKIFYMCYVMPMWRSSLGLIANVIHQKQQVSNSSLRIILRLQSKLRVRLFTITSSKTLKKVRALYIWYNLFMICQHVNCMIIIIRWVRKLICWCIYLSNVKYCKWTKLYINNLDSTLKICFVYIYIYIYRLIEGMGCDSFIVCGKRI